jgi:hypothetical protein
MIILMILLDLLLIFGWRYLKFYLSEKEKKYWREYRENMWYEDYVVWCIRRGWNDINDDIPY